MDFSKPSQIKASPKKKKMTNIKDVILKDMGKSTKNIKTNQKSIMEAAKSD